MALLIMKKKLLIVGFIVKFMNRIKVISLLCITRIASIPPFLIPVLLWGMKKVGIYFFVFFSLVLYWMSLWMFIFQYVLGFIFSIIVCNLLGIYTNFAVSPLIAIFWVFVLELNVCSCPCILLENLVIFDWIFITGNMRLSLSVPSSGH